MPKKRPGRNREKIKKYYESGRHAVNMRKKKDRHIQRIMYFQMRNEKFNILVPQAVKQFLSMSIVSWFRSNVNKDNYSKFINQLADRAQIEIPTPLPRGRVKQELRLQLSKP